MPAQSYAAVCFMYLYVLLGEVLSMPIRTRCLSKDAYADAYTHLAKTLKTYVVALHKVRSLQHPTLMGFCGEVLRYKHQLGRAPCHSEGPKLGFGQFSFWR